MTARGCRRAVAAILLLAATASHAAAQGRPFTADIGLMVFTVRADRADAFEMVLHRLADGLKAAARSEPARPIVGLRLLRSMQSAAADQRLFLMLVEPVVRAYDYSIEQLLAAAVPQDAPTLIQQFRSALVSEPFVADLRVLHSLTPDELMRSRLEAELARSGVLFGASGAGSPPTDADRERLERLRLPLWSIQGFEYRAVETTGASWRFAWRFELVNGSLTGTASADIVVEFRDRDGTVVHSVRAREAGVAVGERRTVSANTLIPSIAASRVATAFARIDSLP